MKAEESLVKNIKDVWNRFDLALGIPVIDMQHIWLISIVLRLEQGLSSEGEEAEEAFQEALAEAVDYTIEHFSLEENLMQDLGFPESEAHRKQHQRFMAALRMRARESNRGDRQAADRMLKSLKQWLFSHILSEDKKYKDFFEENEIAYADHSQELLNSSPSPLREAQNNLYAQVSEQKPLEDQVDHDVVSQVASIWNKYNLKIGIPIIDMQHLWLIQQIVELDRVSRMSSDIRKEKFQETVLHAIDYIKEHFSTEENLMRHFNYGEMDSHVHQHRHFVEFIQERHSQSKDEDMAAVTGLLHDLKEWLISHIAVEDKKLFYFFRKHEKEVAEYTRRLVRENTLLIRKGYLDLYQPIVQYMV